VITGLGVGAGTAASFVPIAAMVIVTIFGVLGFQQAKLRTDCYSEKEMRRATEYWAVHLLVLRDLDMHRFLFTCIQVHTLSTLLCGPRPHPPPRRSLGAPVPLCAPVCTGIETTRIGTPIWRHFFRYTRYPCPSR
jgi:hypothetical protein